MGDPLTSLVEVLASVLTSLKALRYVFSFQDGDIPPCNTRVVKTGRGFIWNRQIAIHPLHDGRLEISAVDLDDQK